MSHDRDRCQHHHNQISKRPSATSAEYQLPTGLVDTQAARLDTPRPRSNFGSLNFLSFENRRASRLAVLYFGLFVFGQLGILLAFIRYAFRSTWNQHVAVIALPSTSLAQTANLDLSAALAEP